MRVLTLILLHNMLPPIASRVRVANPRARPPLNVHPSITRHEYTDQAGLPVANTIEDRGSMVASISNQGEYWADRNTRSNYDRAEALTVRDNDHIRGQLAAGEAATSVNGQPYPIGWADPSGKTREELYDLDRHNDRHMITEWTTPAAEAWPRLETLRSFARETRPYRQRQGDPLELTHGTPAPPPTRASLTNRGGHTVASSPVHSLSSAR